MRPAGRLTTPRLLLRPFREDEAPAVFGYAGRPDFFRYLDHAPLRLRQDYQLADAEEHLLRLRELDAQGWPHWAIIPHAVGRPVGAVRFQPAHDDSGLPELGYGLAPAAWGHGWASEAAAAVLAWCAPDTPTVVARCHPENAASRRLLERLGFAAMGPDANGRLAFCWTAPNLNPGPTSPGTA